MKKSRLYLSYAGFIATVLYGSMNFICLVFYDFFDYKFYLHMEIIWIFILILLGFKKV